jgi:hypothetical protein
LTAADRVDISQVGLPIAVEIADKDGIGSARERDGARNRKYWLGTLRIGGPAMAEKDDKGDRKSGSPKTISEPGKGIHEKGPKLQYFITRAG